MLVALLRQVLIAARTYCLVLGVLFALPVHAQVSEEVAKESAEELRLLVSEGTAVIGELQPMINSGKVDKQQVTPEVLLQRFKARYQKVANRSLDTPLNSLSAQVRAAYLKGFSQVVTAHQSTLMKGGQDAFVPAYFRALVLKDFNQTMQGKALAYAINRDGELINADSNAKRVLKDSPATADEVIQLMSSGSLNPILKRNGNVMMGYWPMKLEASCVACHAQNGLKQEVGKFGGVLIAHIPVK